MEMADMASRIEHSNDLDNSSTSMNEDTFIAQISDLLTFPSNPSNIPSMCIALQTVFELAPNCPETTKIKLKSQLEKSLAPEMEPTSYSIQSLTSNSSIITLQSEDKLCSNMAFVECKHNI